MSTPAEDALYASLTDIDSLEYLAKFGLDLESVPTVSMRIVVDWAIKQYFASGRKQAPSREILLQNFASVLEEADVILPAEDAEVDTIESAVETLVDLHADRKWQTFVKEAATTMATAPKTTKASTLIQVTESLFQITDSLQDHSNQVLASEGFAEMLADYEDRAENGHVTKGMTFGLPPIDNHTYGIHDGELCVCAAGPKVGKSYFLDRVALHEWAVQGRRVVLHTLENSVEMTLGRIVCMHMGLSPRMWQRGTLPTEKVDEVKKFIANILPEMPGSLHVISPQVGRRTPEMLVREAKMLGAESLLIDQLTHVEHPDPARKARHEIFNENVHSLKALISTGRDKMPLLLAHQINRDGVKAAEKTGYHEMWHLAESAGIERAADWVMTMYQSEVNRRQHALLLQIIAARREDTKNWEMGWHVEGNTAKVSREVSLVPIKPTAPNEPGTVDA